MENRLPYSYHTFLFPFIWKTKPEITLGAFEEILQVGTNWTEHKWADMMQAQDVSKDEKKKTSGFRIMQLISTSPQPRAMRFLMQMGRTLLNVMC